MLRASGDSDSEDELSKAAGKQVCPQPVIAYGNHYKKADR